MLLDTPKLANLGAPFVPELVRSLERNLGRVKLIGMNDCPRALPCGEPDQVFDRFVVGPHRLEQRLDSRGVGFGHRRKWVERQQQLVRFFLGYVEHEHRDFDIRCRLRAEMPVDELELAVREFASDQSIGVTDFGQQATQCIHLRLWMPAPVFGIGQQLLCRYPPQLSYTISN
jgi:hypothetical protein